MKFGSQLSSNLHQEWKFQYVDYDELKRLLKSAEEGTGFGDKNESLFVHRIESELDKVSLSLKKNLYQIWIFHQGSC